MRSYAVDRLKANESYVDSDEMPSFDDLCDLRQEIKDLQSLLSALVEGHDVPQRVSDLIVGIEELHRKAVSLLVIKDDI